MLCCRNDSRFTKFKACVSIKFRSHRVGPTNQLSPKNCLGCFYHFQSMIFLIYLLLLFFFLSHLVHSTVVHCIDLGPFPMIPKLKHFKYYVYYFLESRKVWILRTKNACFVAALFWPCNMRRTSSHALSSLQASGLPKWELLQQPKYEFSFWTFCLLFIN